MVCRNRRRSLESGKEPSGEAVAVATHVMAGTRISAPQGRRGTRWRARGCSNRDRWQHPWRLPHYAAKASANCRSNDRSPRARPDTVQRSDRKIAVTLSHDRTGQCWDNALSESFFASLKGELIDLQTWPTRAMARRAVVEYIGWYTGCTALSATAAPPNTRNRTRSRTQPDQVISPVRQSGATRGYAWRRVCRWGASVS
jgi:hypothetical protein